MANISCSVSNLRCDTLTYIENTEQIMIPCVSVGTKNSIYLPLGMDLQAMYSCWSLTATTNEQCLQRFSSHKGKLITLNRMWKSFDVELQKSEFCMCSLLSRNVLRSQLMYKPYAVCDSAKKKKKITTLHRGRTVVKVRLVATCETAVLPVLFACFSCSEYVFKCEV